MTTNLKFEITETLKRNRLDKFLFEKITAVSKIYLQNLLKRDDCLVNGVPQPGGYHLKNGDIVEIQIDLAAETGMQPEAIPLEIIFEDKEIIVINKPAGLLVHPTLGQKKGTLLNALSHHLNYKHFQALNNENGGIHSSSSILQPFIRPGLIHRLDRQTSGLMVISKTDRALRILNDHFHRKLVEKKYIALVGGIVADDFGIIDAPIGHYEDLKFWGVKTDGKKAETRFRVLERRPDATLLEFEPVTGRTHQLRIHCAHLGHPIIGDQLRGGREFPRLCLHAYRLCFWHPDGFRRLEFECEIPQEFLQGN